MDLDADFEAAAALAAAPFDDAVEQLAELDENFALAAAIVEVGPLRQPLGFTKRGPASTAYARKCKEVKRADAKIGEFEAKLKDLRERTVVQEISGSLNLEQLRPFLTTAIDLGETGCARACSDDGCFRISGAALFAPMEQS